MLTRARQLTQHTTNLVRAFRLGLHDGLDQGIINMGMTYDCDQHQWCWDQGANLGEWLHQHNTCTADFVRRAIRP